MHLGIDASNLRMGGGVTHLSRLLSSADPRRAGIDAVSVWACQQTADTLPERDWLHICQPDWVGSALPARMLAQQFRLPAELREKGCDVLFSPGGTLPRWPGIVSVTMSQNMLPFEPAEAARFGRTSPMWFKFKLLKMAQSRSFRQSDGLIFLTEYAKDAVQRSLGSQHSNVACIPHGIEPRFISKPRVQRPIGSYKLNDPFRLLYVSIVMPYKHQIALARAVKLLRDKGLPVEIQFVGASWKNYGEEFRQELKLLDPQHRFLHWSGSLPFDELHAVYQQADAFVFASSCENLPNIMIEAMAAGLPIASSRRGPMPEVLGEAGVYFDPDSVPSITDALITLLNDEALRTSISNAAWQKALTYSWERCAEETFSFIVSTKQKNGVRT